MLSFAVLLITPFSAAPVPEQIHLALTETSGTMRVTWVTMLLHDCAGNVEYSITPDSSPEKPPATVAGSNYTYAGDSFAGTLHTAVMTGIPSGATVNYTVVSCAGERSPMYAFNFNPDPSGTLNFLAYGDMGVKNSVGTVAMANREAATGAYHLFVNVGDTSYADDDGPHGSNGYIFDEHFRNIEGHAARMPFMSCPGNHEGQYDFAPYIARLRNPIMAGATAKLAPFYYSYDYGPVHFIAYSSEHPLTAGSEQFSFIKRDLAAASAPAARALRPWIVIYTHHPMYCSDLVTWGSRCVSEANAFRADLAELMENAGVDIHMSGHNHQYERTHSVTGCVSETLKAPTNCNISTVVHNHPHPIYIVNGAGGDTEGADPSWTDDTFAPYRAFHDAGFHTGYGRGSVNKTTFVWEFVYSGTGAIPGTNASHPGTDDGQVIDRVVLTKGPLGQQQP